MHGCSAISTVAFCIVWIVMFAMKWPKNAVFFLYIYTLHWYYYILSDICFANILLKLKETTSARIYFVWSLCLKRYFVNLVRSYSAGNVSDVWSIYDINIAYLLDFFTIVMTGWNKSGRRANVWKIRIVKTNPKWWGVGRTSDNHLPLWLQYGWTVLIFCLYFASL